MVSGHHSVWHSGMLPQLVELVELTMTFGHLEGDLTTQRAFFFLCMFIINFSISPWQHRNIHLSAICSKLAVESFAPPHEGSDTAMPANIHAARIYFIASYFIYLLT